MKRRPKHHPGARTGAPQPTTVVRHPTSSSAVVKTVAVVVVRNLHALPPHKIALTESGTALKFPFLPILQNGLP